MKSFKQFVEAKIDENIGGLFKNASEWESSAKSRGLVVKSMAHPSGEATKYQIAKDKQGNNRGHFDHGTKSGRLKEEVELDEVSASTLRSYIDKSRTDKKAAMKDRTAASNNMKKYGNMAMDRKDHADASRRVVNRSTGISVANQKLNTYPKDAAKAKVMAREEIELDEVSDLQKAFIDSMQKKLKKSSSLRDPNAKTAREEDRIAKMLAAKAKMKKEEVEQIDELSKETLTSYAKKADKQADKASQSYSNAAARRHDFAPDTPAMAKNAKKFAKRDAGSALAKDKLAKMEEVELDEADGTKRNRELLATGRISKDEFDKRMGYGKYKTKDNSKKLDGPGGLYKNLVKRLGEEADLDEEKDPRIERAGVQGFNKPKATPSHPEKSHIVVAKDGNQVKTIRFGQQGAETAGDPKEGESERMKMKRKSFKARHGKNIAKGKMSAAFWADKVKW